jgi:hypothetical protein
LCFVIFVVVVVVVGGGGGGGVVVVVVTVDFSRTLSKSITEFFKLPNQVQQVPLVRYIIKFETNFILG